MTTDVTLQNPIVTAVQAVKSGSDVVPVSSSNPLPVAQPDGLAVSGTVIGTAAYQATSGIPLVLFTTSMLNYESITVQVTSAGSSCTVTYETSDNNTNWFPCSGLSVTNAGYTPLTSTTTTTGIFQFGRKSMYFRARVSIYGSGTVTVVGTLSKVSIGHLGSIFIGGGQVSEGASAALGGNPLAIALEARIANKTIVTNGQTIRPISTTDGRQITRLNSIPENEWQYAVASGGITNTTDVVLQAAAGSGIKNYLTGLSIANANATATEVVLKDGSSTVIWRMYLSANAPIQSIKFVTPLQSTANTALNVACITTGTQTYINAQGYKAP